MAELSKAMGISKTGAPTPPPGGASAGACARSMSSPDFASDLARLLALLGAPCAAEPEAEVATPVAEVATPVAEVATPVAETGDPVEALCAEVALAQPGHVPIATTEPDAAPSEPGPARTLQVTLTPPGATRAADHRAAQAPNDRAMPALPLLPTAASGAAAFTVTPTPEAKGDVSNTDAPDLTAIIPLNAALPSEAAPRAAPATAASAPVDILQPHAARQIAETVTWHVPAQGAAEVRIRLNPEELGPLDVQLRLDGDKVSVRFDMADERVRDVVQSSLPSLSSMLSARGLQLDQAQVFAQARGHASPQQQQHSTPAPGWADRGDRDAGDGLSVSAATRPLIRRGLLDDYA